jgi:hypothetical protein
MDDTDAGHRNLWLQTTAALEKGVFDFAFTNSRSPEMPKLALAASCGFEGSAPDTIRARFSARGRREARVAQACTGTPVITTIQTLPPTMAFSFVNQTKILGSYEATAELSGCSGFNTTNPLRIFTAHAQAFRGGSSFAVSGRQYTMPQPIFDS